ncbi:MAG TPA: hypothetical protein VNW94_18375 [Streptosporangiaceae bacterium]|nr:hypothetical protein [Streptosporangiaceae bacterium]
MRIPERVDTAWTWLERHGRIVVIATALGSAGVAALFLPALAALIAGLAIGGLAVQVRMGRRVARLRAEIDDLLRETGSLRHQKNVLGSGVIEAQSKITEKLIVIPEEEP